MFNKKLLLEEQLNEELLGYSNFSDILFNLKKYPGIIFSGVIVHNKEFHRSNGAQIAVVFFHGGVQDELLNLLHLNAFIFPDEIAELIYVDSLEHTTSEIFTLKKRILANFSQISRFLQGK